MKTALWGNYDDGFVSRRVHISIVVFSWKEKHHWTMCLLLHNLINLKSRFKMKRRFHIFFMKTSTLYVQKYLLSYEVFPILHSFSQIGKYLITTNENRRRAMYLHYCIVCCYIWNSHQVIMCLALYTQENKHDTAMKEPSLLTYT